MPIIINDKLWILFFVTLLGIAALSVVTIAVVFAVLGVIIAAMLLAELVVAFIVGFKINV